MRYDEARPRLQTGDILLFAGKGFISQVIKRMTGSPWSHVGMVYRPAEDVVLCWESTTLTKVKDEYAGRPVKGVQLVQLSARVGTYDGAIAWRRLITPRSPATLAEIDRLRHELAGRPYEEDVLDLVRAALRRNDVEDAQTLFCSELVATVYRAVGWLPPLPLPANYQPGDWDGDGLAARHLTTALLPAVELTP